MISLITGTPGSGKTLFAVSQVLEHAKKGRNVYCDIDGLNIQGVMPIPEDLDWRDTPEGSLVVYDEAQQNDIFKAGRGTLSENQIVKDLEVHRHTGHDIIFITQSPIFMHNHIRQLVGEHMHLHRPYGAAVASVYQWRVCETNPNTESAKKRSENNRMFNFDKKLFEHYKSATVHTHKFKIPTKIRNGILLIVGLCCLCYYFFMQTSYFHRADTAKPEQTEQSAQVQNTTTDPAVAPAPAPAQDTTPKLDDHELTRVAQVIQFGADCYAKNSFGELLDISAEQCRLYSDRPSLLSGSRNRSPQANQPSYTPTSALDPLTQPQLEPISFSFGSADQSKI